MLQEKSFNNPHIRKLCIFTISGASGVQHRSVAAAAVNSGEKKGKYFLGVVASFFVVV